MSGCISNVDTARQLDSSLQHLDACEPVNKNKLDLMWSPSACSCNIWALLYGLCNHLDDNGRNLFLQMLSEHPKLHKHPRCCRELTSVDPRCSLSLRVEPEPSVAHCSISDLFEIRSPCYTRAAYIQEVGMLKWAALEVYAIA